MNLLKIYRVLFSLCFPPWVWTKSPLKFISKGGALSSDKKREHGGSGPSSLPPTLLLVVVPPAEFRLLMWPILRTVLLRPLLVPSTFAVSP